MGGGKPATPSRFSVNLPSPPQFSAISYPTPIYCVGGVSEIRKQSYGVLKYLWGSRKCQLFRAWVKLKNHPLPECLTVVQRSVTNTKKCKYRSRRCQKGVVVKIQKLLWGQFKMEVDIFVSSLGCTPPPHLIFHTLAH